MKHNQSDMLKPQCKVETFHKRVIPNVKSLWIFLFKHKNLVLSNSLPLPDN